MSGSNATTEFDTFNDVRGNQYNASLNQTFQGPTAIYTNVTGNLVQTMNTESNAICDQVATAQDNLIGRLKIRLNSVNPLGDSRPQCLKGTRKETLRDIYDWVNANRLPNVLLLIGGMGMGKSTIATTVAETHRGKGQLGCYLFFTREKSNPSIVLPTIAYRLALYSTHVAEAIEKQLKDVGELSSATLRSKPEFLLRRPLSEAAAKISSPVLIVLDAIDECGNHETRRSLLEVLRDGLPTLPPNFRFLITTRPKNDFSRNPSPKFQVIKLDEKSKESKSNVFMYIKHEFEQMKLEGELLVPDNWPWDTSIRILADKADGLFIWAATAVKFVKEEGCYSFGRFENLVKNAKFLNLSELYKTVLEEAVPREKESKVVFRSVFSLIFFSKSPLSDRDINGILDLGGTTTSTLLSRFRSLITYEENKPIKIHHSSFYNYLVSCKGCDWYIDEKVEKEKIVRVCFDQMKKLLRYNMCHLKSSAVFNANISNLDERLKENIPPSLRYICCNWAYHLRDVPYSQEICDKVRLFARNHLLFWFEVLSLTGKFNDRAGTALLSAIAWVGKKDPDLVSLLRDGYLLASIFSEPISKSVRHIYTSLLPLTDVMFKESLLLERYSGLTNANFKIQPVGQRFYRPCIRVIEEGDRETSFLSFTNDGTRIISGRKDGSIHIRDSTCGKLIISPLEHTTKSKILSVVITSNPRYIISVTELRYVGKWDMLTGCLVWEKRMIEKRADREDVIMRTEDDWSETKGNPMGIWSYSAAFSPNGKFIAFGSYEGEVEVWGVETGRRYRIPTKQHFMTVTSLSFSPDAKYLVSGSEDTKINVWDINKGKVEELGQHSESIRTIQFSPSGKSILSGSLDRTIRVWNVSTKEMLFAITCHDAVEVAIFSPDGSHILAGGREWMSMWNIERRVVLSKTFPVDDCISRIAFTPDNSRFVSDGPSGIIQIWDASKDGITTRSFQQRNINSISVSPDSKRIASGSYDGTIYLWDVESGRAVSKLVYGRSIDSISYSPNDQNLIAFGCSEYKTVNLWNVTNVSSVEIGNHYISTVVFSPDGKYIASGSFDNTICIWDIENRKLAVGPLNGHTDSVNSVAYSGDGKRLVSGSRDKTVRIWNSENGQLISTFEGHYSAVKTVAYSNDGLRIVSGSGDTTIIIWDSQSDGTVISRITAHERTVNSVCFSLSGNRILSGSSDGTIGIWDATSGKPLSRPILGHGGVINSVALFPNGRHFVTSSRDGAIRIWESGNVCNDMSWDLRDDNWIVGNCGELLMWLPNDLRAQLCVRRCSSMLNLPSYFKLLPPLPSP
ncbi:nucleotide-binding-oligomerization-domain like receptor [Pyrrhoderma noxium]|uniref:Nucleotide-binding-oligomerization-domain like receptor n=1 Tax=Pyrrhoderma noxium TaxID=2282107 RepID=A0A286UK95_9AGAM|nr:nucleotide-binding-oligomerization-domain like receptor [Pyrrhoderma noxium]